MRGRGVLGMEKTLSRIRNLRARRKLSLPASPSPGHFSARGAEARSGSEDDLVEWSVRIRALIPDLQPRADRDEGGGGGGAAPHHHEVKKSNSERRKVVQWDLGRFPGRAQSEKSAAGRKKRSGSVSVIAHKRSDECKPPPSDSPAPAPAPAPAHYPPYPYPRHGSLPHAFRAGARRQQLGLGELMPQTQTQTQSPSPVELGTNLQEVGSFKITGCKWLLSFAHLRHYAE